MHPVLKKGPLFYKKIPPPTFHFFYKETPPIFHFFYKKTPPFHFLPTGLLCKKIFTITITNVTYRK